MRCREIGFSRAAEARDAGHFASFIDADARFVGDSVVRGPDAIAAAWAAFFEAEGPSVAWRPQFVEVLDDGTLALTRGPYRIITTDEDGIEAEHRGTFNSIWRLDADGEWRVVFDAGGPAAVPPPATVKGLLNHEDSCSAAAR